MGRDLCEFINKKQWCKKHECIVKSIDVTSTKWTYIQSKKCYGNVRRKCKKYICVNRMNNDCVRPDPPTEGNTVMPASEPMPEIEPENEFVDGIRSQGDRQVDILGCLKARVS